MHKYVKETNLSFEEAEKKFKEAIEEVGLKVVGEVMPSKKIKMKLGIEIPSYKILFICNPKYVYDLINVDYDIGALVPCHGFVYERDGKVYVGVNLPTKTLTFAGEKVVEYIKTAEEQLIKAVDSVA
ncbi:DUF302 domain-containing protein [Thermococcus sp. M39]|uniref:DUF302 domain-containing protein n=1 Tax=unclassified Thermococcus TaxID=2627626 RepID=UPI00143B5E6D|nr:MULTISPECIES: DUF302 domain-containing protein [unclassified Thermococcus]NJE09011.1 DUF302 domain-containing protein [Thermococcus sp. M39]NJE13324.1 DUF302 domain-containing protein [Thermococcus sp. LS2]